MTQRSLFLILLAGVPNLRKSQRKFKRFAPDLASVIVMPNSMLASWTISKMIHWIHGTEDKISPVDQSREYEQAARAANKSLTKRYIEGAGHLATMAFGSDAVREEAIGYLKARLPK